ncbi:DUF4097 family beta strand repeat-containing protein [Curtobacterium sp. MCSS17_007]|uniref:DUF4097 family beta strand repeat-containing protein n=1 Tax=Curtobacterium sp. MCSS17_007 TaxID=2175646 RepID=UPI000DA933C2|nr:DUF4097 family beta strand repeat-containing protein [Curtobacterium sp. MCSS17_007]WIE76194.1 DUF4097 family beta strand repeat-containing protein [Curtobacterium sp. MCSS17_007]
MAQEKWLVEEPKVIDTGIVRALRVGLAGGQVDVVAHDEPTARVEVHSVSGKALKIELEGDTLTIDHPQIRWDDPVGFLRSFRGRASADVSVLVPRDARVTVGVVSAGALLSGTNRGASLNTVSGDVVVDGLAGDLAVHAVSGTTTVRDLEGDLTVRTVSGDVVATGAIPRFAADGVNADVVLDLQGTPDAARVNTVSGSVSVRLEDGVPYRCTVSTASGKLQFDDSEIRGVRGSYVKQGGDLSGQWLDLKVNSVSGDIAVLHASPAPAAPTPDDDETVVPE